MYDFTEALTEMGWEITRAAHGSTCSGCQAMAMNATGIIGFGGTGETSRTFPLNATPPQHQATITRKDS